ncbi:MAG TPA: hypothetical protein VM759_12075 [Longimicrobium sp.]|nr:hypothetical protein [Longimicrobium sp.]
MAEPATNTSFVHPLTQKLHPDADRFGDRATVVGYPGPSPQQGRVRVYLDTTFTSYYELDTRAVLDTVPAKANDENSPTVVVIAASAQVDVVRVDAGQSQARYLEGSITSDYLPAAGTQPWGGQPTGFPCVATVTVGGAADCACILLSAVGNTLAGQGAQARGPLCCNPTYTAGNCTRNGPTMAGAVPAWQGEGCIQLGATTICTPTGVQYLCPGNV